MAQLQQREGSSLLHSGISDIITARHKRRVLRFRVCVASQSARDSAAAAAATAEDAAAAQGISLMEEKKRWRRRHKQINVVPFNNREKIKFPSTSSSSPAAPQNRTTYFCSRREKERHGVFARSFEFDSARSERVNKNVCFHQSKRLICSLRFFCLINIDARFFANDSFADSISNELLHSI